MKNKKAKVIILLSLYFSLLFIPKEKNDPEVTFRFKNNIEYTSYSNGKVFIAKAKYISKIYDENSTDVYVIDQRERIDSNMEIMDSYKIKSRAEMEEVINILLQYEKIHPSAWNRSYYSMLVEWDMHTFCHKCNIDVESTKHVDLNNADKEKYNEDYLIRLLGYK